MALPNGEEERRRKLRELGARVRARREELGMSLEQVSDRTKIRTKYLTAVEEGDDSVSPGKTYFRAFLKTYASFLGLDGTEFSNRYGEIEREAEEEAARPKDFRARPHAAPTPQPAAKPAPPETPATGTSGVRRVELDDTPAAATLDSGADKPDRSAVRRRRMPSERRRRGSPVWVFLALVLVACAAYYVVVYRPELIGLSSGENPPSLGEDPSGELPATGDNIPGGPGADPVEPDPGSEPVEPPAPVVTREDPTAEKSVWSVDRTPVELVLKLASESDAYCWVSVTIDGEFAFERTLSPEEIVELSADSEITIRAGKPWVMNLLVNGQDMGPAGEFGPVKDLVFRSSITAE
jgi:transcriptional regulator with XRE-family HTH domain